jgi:acyl-CoA synthetase (AMP-forming)/AMP-acid ligase II
MPATSALGAKDIADRVGRGAARHVITNADQVDKFADIPRDFGRIAIGDAPRHQPGGGVGPRSGHRRRNFRPCHRNLAPYQRIRRIEFMELPKTISGKIRRVDLRARENACEPND